MPYSKFSPNSASAQDEKSFPPTKNRNKELGEGGAWVHTYHDLASRILGENGNS